MKKILLINNGYPSETNKQYTAYVKSIKECLELSGQQVQLLVMYADFTSTRLSKIKSYLKYYYKLFVFKNYKDYDYVYINNYPHSFLPLIFKLKSMKNLIIHWHGADIFAEKQYSKILNQFSYFFIPKSCKHIAPSKYFANAVSNTLKIPFKNIFISASGGVDTNLFVPKKKKKDGFHIGFASHVSKEKGFELFAMLIKNVEILEKKVNTKLYFHYINYGNEKEYYYNRLQDNDSVTIHELYAKDKMSNFYAKIDLLLFPTSLAESLGLVNLEAMSCNVPVIGSDAFATKEYIIDGQTGERFKLESYDDLLEKIEHVINKYKYYKPRDFIVKTYSQYSVANSYKEYFDGKS